jgi:hypothetical protein
MTVFCDEKIIAVYLGQNEYHDIDGANCWFDIYHDIAFHTTEGYRLLLETDSYMISLGADGVTVTNKDEFKPVEHEWLEEYVHNLEDEVIINFEATLFVDQRILSVDKTEEFYLIQFDDFALKMYVYELGKMDKSLRNRDHWSYNNVLGFDRFIKAKCPLCGGDGEILLDFVSDYVVRCKSCKKSTYAEMQLRHAIDHWNDGEVQCDLSDITIE